MNKLQWFQLDRPQRVAYIEEKLDKLKVEKNIHFKKELEKQVFEILDWEKIHE